MNVGKRVILSQYGDEVIERVVVAVENNRIYVCKQEEFEDASRQGREPVSVGFRAEDLIEAK